MSELAPGRKPAGDALLSPGTMPAAGNDRRIPEVNSIHSQYFDNPIHHLARARQFLQQGRQYYAQAVQEFMAGIAAADRLNPAELEAERKKVQEQLKTETNFNKRRQLLQLDADLDDLQQAPGATVANLGMLYVRLGNLGCGVLLIALAGMRNPRMFTDPNFIKAMATLNIHTPGDARMPGAPTSPDYFRGHPTAVLPHVPGDSGLPGTAAPGDQGTGNPGYVKVTGIDEQTRMPTGNIRPDSQGMVAAPLNPMFLMNKAEKRVQEQKWKVTEETVQEFEAAITAADNLDRGYIREKMEELYKNGNISALAKQYKELGKSLKEEHPQSFAQLSELDKQLQAARTDTERKRIESEMDEIPHAKELLAKQNELYKATAPIVRLKGLLDSSILTRLSYAGSLSYDAGQIEQVLAGNLARGQRQAVADLTNDGNLTAEQKAQLEEIYRLPTLSSEKREQLVQIAGAGNLNNRQHNQLSRIVGQFDMSEEDKSKATKQIAALKYESRNLLEQIISMDKGGFVRAEDKFIKIAQHVSYEIPPLPIDDKVKAKPSGDELPLPDEDIEKKDKSDDTQGQAAKTGDASAQHQQLQAAYAQVGTAMEQVSAAMEQIGAAKEKLNFKQSLAAYEKAIEEADTIDMSFVARALKATEEQLKALPKEAGSAELSTNLLNEQNLLKAIMQWPSQLRLQAAALLLEPLVHKPDQAKEKLDQAAALLNDKKFLAGNPDFVKSPAYKALMDQIAAGQKVSEEYGKSNLEKTLAWAKKEGWDLASDIGSMSMAGIVLGAMNPEAGIARRLLYAAGSAAATQEFMQHGVNVPKYTLSDAGRGGVMGLIGAGGLKANSALRSRLSSLFDAAAFEKQALSLLRTDAEKIALKGVFQKLATERNLHSIDALCKVLKADCRNKLNAATLQEQLSAMGITAKAELTKLDGKEGTALVEAFKSVLQSNPERASIQALETFAKGLGASEESLAKIKSAGNQEAMRVCQEIFKKHVEGQKELAGQAYQKGAAASKLAVKIAKEKLAQEEAWQGFARAELIRAKQRLLQRLLRPVNPEYELESYGSWVKTCKNVESTVKNLKKEIMTGRVSRLGAWAKSWLPWVKGKEGSIYREYSDLCKSARALEGPRFKLSYLNPNSALNLWDKTNAGSYRFGWFGFKNPNSFSSMNNLMARSYWNKYRVDWTTIGLMSFLYRGTDNAVHTVVPDEKTGKTLSAGQAALDTLKGAARDATEYAFLMPMIREMATPFMRSGSLSESMVELKNPWHEVRTGLLRRGPGRLYDTTNYLLKCGAAKTGKFAVARTEKVTARYPRLPLGLSELPAFGTLLIPRIPEAWNNLVSVPLELGQDLKANKKPIEDMNLPDDLMERQEKKEELEMEVQKGQRSSLNYLQAVGQLNNFPQGSQIDEGTEDEGSTLQTEK